MHILKKEYASVKTEKEWFSYGTGKKEIYHFVPWENRFDWEEKSIKPKKVPINFCIFAPNDIWCTLIEKNIWCYKKWSCIS